jgi:hypothetical protein
LVLGFAWVHEASRWLSIASFFALVNMGLTMDSGSTAARCRSAYEVRTVIGAKLLKGRVTPALSLRRVRD